MAQQVNSAIVEATKTENVSDVIRWNAKRQLLDDVQAFIHDTIEERDRLARDQREQEEEEQRWAQGR